MAKYISKFTSAQEANTFFTSYLKEKSNYHAKRASYIASLIPTWAWENEKPVMQRALEHEQAKSEILKSPTSDIVKIEAYKIQFMQAFRQAFKAMDENVHKGNPLLAPSAYLYAIHCLQVFRHELEQSQNNLWNRLNSNKQTYLSGQLDYSNYWLNNLKTWTHSIFTDVQCNARKDKSALEPYWANKLKYISPNSKKERLGDFEPTPDISKILNYPMDTYYSTLSISSLPWVRDAVNQIKTQMRQQKQYDSYTLLFSSQMKELKKQREDLLTANFKFLYSQAHNRYLNMLTSSLYGLFKANDMWLSATELMNKSAFSDSLSQKFLTAQRDFALACKDIYLNQSNRLFETLYNNFTDTDLKAKDKLPGYSDMNNFTIDVNPGISWQLLA